MVADILTKPLVRDLHWKFVKAMGLRLHSSGSDSINHEPHSGSGGSEFPVPFRTRKDQRYFSNDWNRFRKVLAPFRTWNHWKHFNRLTILYVRLNLSLPFVTAPITIHYT